MKQDHWFLLVLTGLLMFSCRVMAIDNNLSFSGTLVSEPCELDPTTTDLTVDFQSVIEKSLYSDTRTTSIPFTIRLINCDVSLSSLVTLTFKGTESSKLPGFLATTGAATGIAVGMEQLDGTLLPFNKPTPAVSLTSGVNSITLNAFVEGEPDAIDGKSITPGTFSASATFEMSYE